MLTKGYPINASLSLVGNHWRLNKRQRASLSRASAPNQRIENISNNEIQQEGLPGKTILLDGFNILILLESALSGAFIFECADGTYRDLSGVHGSYKRVKKTNTALILIGEELQKLNPSKVVWILDAPVSNSGRLKVVMAEISEEHQFNWDIILDNNPDGYIVEKGEIAISSDNWIIERSNWFNLGRRIIDTKIPDAEIFQFKKHGEDN